jgi:transcriptional regulator with GAF, ATPase, and Fis domain
MTAEGAALQRAARDVVALSTLPAAWRGYSPQQIANDLADVLLHMADLDVVHLALQTDEAVSATRTRRPADASDPRVQAAIERLLQSRAFEPQTILDPLDSERSLRALAIPGDENTSHGLIAASRNPAFPTAADRLVLTLALNQARIAVGHQHAERLQEENIVLRGEIDERLMMGSVIGRSEAMREVLSNVDQVAPAETTVLITGETGTGKELIAREIHRRSRRADGPMIAVHPAALPSSLLASELFGHERGAFTGALQRRAGRFELASRGTIFLDEIGELPPETQLALLRVLQERTFERVGGSQTLRTAARVVAATHRDLQKMVREGTFREDLYYRLTVFPIHIPPLRERRADIPPLVEHFTQLFARRLDKTIGRISRASMSRLTAYSWPGNVRELENVIERAVILTRGEELLVPAALFPRPSGTASGALPRRLEEIEKAAIENALAESKGRIGGPAGAAARLGMRRTTLYSKLARHHINPARFKTS